jgi:hypothetical protein
LAILDGSSEYSYVPIALETGVFRTLSKTGQPIPSVVEPFVMGFLHGWWRGYGLEHLGTPQCPDIRLIGCAGQFNYQLTERARAAHGGVAYSAAVCMDREHVHAPGRCHVAAMNFQGIEDRMRLYGFHAELLPRRMVS